MYFSYLLLSYMLLPTSIYRLAHRFPGNKEMLLSMVQQKNRGSRYWGSKSSWETMESSFISVIEGPTIEIKGVANWVVLKLRRFLAGVVAIEMANERPAFGNC